MKSAQICSLWMLLLDLLEGGIWILTSIAYLESAKEALAVPDSINYISD